MSNQDPKIRAAERAHDTHDRFINETQKAAVQTGTDYLKQTALINGAAAVAIITLLSTLFGQGKYPQAQLRDVAWSLLWFANGVAASVISLGLGYWVNYSTQAYEASKQQIWEHPYFQPTATTALWERRMRITTGLSFTAGMIAIALFIVGVYAVYDAMGKLKT